MTETICGLRDFPGVFDKAAFGKRGRAVDAVAVTGLLIVILESEETNGIEGSLCGAVVVFSIVFFTVFCRLC